MDKIFSTLYSFITDQFSISRYQLTISKFSVELSRFFLTELKRIFEELRESLYQFSSLFSGYQIIMGSSQLFRPLDADDPEPETTTIESLCMNCGDNVPKYTFQDFL